jgi:hypothetical protein
MQFMSDGKWHIFFPSHAVMGKENKLGEITMNQNPISTLANQGITWHNQPWHEWDVTLFTGT